MKKTNLLFAWLFLLLLCSSNISAQDGIPDNKGKEFWIMFSQNVGTPKLSLFITGDVTTSGTVEIPGLSFSTPFSVTPMTITTIELPGSATAIGSDVIENKGIHIIAEEEVTVYGLNLVPFTTDAYLALPTDVLNQEEDSEYIIMSYTNAGPTATSQFGIVGTKDNTSVTIIPSNTVTSHPAGIPFTVIIDEGQTYQLQAIGSSTNDLTGTIVSSNKPIAVFSGHICAYIPPNTFYCDNLVEQIPPTTTWGEKFVTAPLATRLAGDIFRILASKDNTQVDVMGINGFTQSFNLNQGEFQELDIPSNEYTEINSSEPILVAQFSKGDESDPSIVNGDPFMLLIPSLEQFQNGYTITTPETGFNLNFVNVIAPENAVGNITLDGSIIPSSEFTAIGGSGFFAAQVSIELGTHNLSGSAPFGVSIYGFADDESYGYLGGQAFGEVASVEKIVLSIEPIIGQGNKYCFIATAVDGDGNPINGVRVDFVVRGANDTEGFMVTNAKGIAEFCYTPENTGTDVITATVGNVSAQATVTIEKPVPSSLTLVIEPDTVVVGEKVCATGTVLDQFGDPLEGVEVFTEVDGELVGSGITDENGEVEYCFIPTAGGLVEIVCYYAGGERVAAEVRVIDDNGGPLVESFSLVDAKTDTDISMYTPIQDKAVINLAGKPKRVDFRANTDPEKVGSVKLVLEGAYHWESVENAAPYALFDDVNGDYNGRVLGAGSYILTATPYSESNLGGEKGESLQISFEIVFDSEVLSLALVNAKTNMDIEEFVPLEDGDIINLSELPNNWLNIRADADPEMVGSVKFNLEGPIQWQSVENQLPYALFMDTGGNYKGRKLLPGVYTLTATPYSNQNMHGVEGMPLIITFEVVENNATAQSRTSISADKSLEKKVVASENIRMNADRLSAYPVPFNDQLTMNVPFSKEVQISLIDLVGTEHAINVYPSGINNTAIETSGLNLARGIYFIKVLHPNGFVQLLKVQKQ